MEAADAERSNRALEYLSKKKAAIMGPGSKLSDIYYSNFNTTQSLEEVTYVSGRYFTNLSNNQMNGQGNVIIPNVSFCGEVYLRLSLLLRTGQSICRGWGYAVLDLISYTIGASNTNNVQINQMSIYNTIMGQCESEEKRSRIIELAGQEFLSVPADTLCEAFVLLPFPFSTACGLYSKLLLDTNLINNPIQLNIRFKQPQSIMGIGASVQPLPSQFIDCTVYLRQGDLKNFDMSLRTPMLRDSSLVYSYPFIHSQSYETSALPVTAGQTQSVPLLSFINGDLVGMALSVVNVADQVPAVATDCPSPLVINSYGINNIQVIWNGLSMYNAPSNQAYKFYNLHSSIGSQNILYSKINPGNTSSNPIDVEPIYIDFGRIRVLCFDNQFQNTFNIANNTLTFQFQVNVTGVYRVYATYYFNSLLEVQNGQTAIIY